MPFPRKKDNTLDFEAFERIDEALKDAVLMELKATGTPAEHKQARAYFEAQENESGEQLRQIAELTAQLTARNAFLEKNNALIMSTLSSRMTENLQNSDSKNKKCTIS